MRGVPKVQLLVGIGGSFDAMFACRFLPRSGKNNTQRPPIIHTGLEMYLETPKVCHLYANIFLLSIVTNLPRWLIFLSVN